MPERITIGLDAEAEVALAELASYFRGSKTNAINRALVGWAQVWRAYKKGCRIVIIEGEGDQAKEREVMFL